LTVEAAVRQAYGATELLIDSENPDLANPMAFLKEISSDGDANSLDVISRFPFPSSTLNIKLIT